MKTAVLIPARMESSRLPGKVLMDICGKPMVQWVYEAAAAALGITEVHIATDSSAVEEACRAFGASVLRTSAAHRSGTDRVAEAALSLDAEAVVNLQADEPLVDPGSLTRLAEALEPGGVRMASLMAPISGNGDLRDPSVVKVVCDPGGGAVSFSRTSTPDAATRREFRHIGVYGYRREALMEFAALPQAPLERTEGLEQLRALAHGWRIQMVEVAVAPASVDTAEDLAAVRALAERVRSLSRGTSPWR